MLGTLLERVLAEDTLSLGQLAINVIELQSRLLDLLQQALIVSLVFLVIIALLGVQVIQFSLISKADLLNLLLEG